MEILIKFTPEEQELMDILKAEGAGWRDVSDVTPPEHLRPYFKTLCDAGLVDQEQEHGHLEYGHTYRFTRLGEKIMNSNPLSIILPKPGTVYLTTEDEEIEKRDGLVIDAFGPNPNM